MFIESLHHAQQLLYHLQKLVLKTPILDWIKQYQITELRVMAPVDRPFVKLIQSLDLLCIVTFTPNNRFIWQDQELVDWARSRSVLT